MLSTAVVGAGPAGLFFVLIGKILMGEQWRVSLFDKREQYVRTHRLRMAPEPYLEVQRQLNDARFDQLIAFLTEHRFTPEVNVLEAKLTELIAACGVTKSLKNVTTLEELSGFDTIVGADSVRSTLRELVRGEVRSTKQTHERVARLRVSGADLPARLGVVDQFRLSKVLGSVVDYRLNRNGFAEVDLFLTENEWLALRSLGAAPDHPVEIASRQLGKLQAPLCRAIVQQLEGEGRKVVVQSTFLLEHEVMPRVGFERVFLVGDAGVSLPFFRGMACLVSCAFALAKAHASGELTTYDAKVAEIVARELKVVRARARAVRGLRELVRVSSLLPLPIQSWWLSAAKDPEPDRLSAGTVFNAVVATAALGLAALGVVSPWLSLLALPMQLGGGIAYRWTLELEPGPHRYLRRIWELQIALAAGAGVGLAALGHMPWLAAGLWLPLGFALAAGLLIFERFVKRLISAASLESLEP